MTDRRFSNGVNGPSGEEPELPFLPKKSDWGSWIYDHRVGLCTTVLAYLILAFAFVTVRITVGGNEAAQGFYIDLEELIQEKERLEEEIRQREVEREEYDERYFEEVRNILSNEDGQLDPNLRDDRGTPASDIYEEARALEGRLNESRQLYEQGVEAADNILQEGRSSSNADESGARQAARAEGKVTVSYYLPGRTAVHLPIPAYQCEGGGEVTVNISVNRNGAVTTATVAAGSSADPCLRSMAIRAANGSSFNVDGTADNRQQGTITYLFVPQ